MSKLLTRELARHILGKFGLVPPPNLGKVGITTREYLLDKQIKIEYDNAGSSDVASFPLWCGTAMLSSTDSENTNGLTVLATDLYTDEYHEFCAVFMVSSSNIIHGVKHIFSDYEDALFLIYNNNKWNPSGLRQKLLITAGVEQLADLGATWIPDKKYELLYDRLVDLVEMGG